MPSVLQSWVENIPIKMQSTLVLGLRGPDTHACPNLKQVTRWMRGVTFKPGKISNLKEFMGGDPPEILEKNPIAKELEFCSQHYYSHLMHSLEVIAFNHPNSHVAGLAFLRFHQMCFLFHLNPETKEQFEHRLRDEVWPEGQPGDFYEACCQLERAENRSYSG